MVTQTIQEMFLEDVLLQENIQMHSGDGSVDIQGKPALKDKTGSWKACPFILGNEFSERLAYYGIAFNLVSFLTSKLHQGNVPAARNVAIWSGTCYLTPLLGAFVADAYWGRYRTIVVFSFIYFTGMCTLTLSASISTLKPAKCVGLICPSATPMQYGVFFSGLYLITLGTGGIKPCVAPFGADQFDDTDPKERLKKGSFFNWYFFCLSVGSLLAGSFVIWVQENVGWGIGFGIPAVFMGIAIVSFFSGSHLYRFQRPGGSPFTRVFQVLVASWCKRKLQIPNDSTLLYEISERQSAMNGSRKLEHTEELKCLDKAAILSESERESGDCSKPWRLCTVTQVEELKILIRLFPIWITAIIFYAANSQLSTTFVLQGKVMETSVGSFTVPAASLTTFEIISILLWLPFYDKVLVRVARKFTGKDRGISELQRMAIGQFFSVLSLVSAAVIEIVRLQLAKEMGLVHENVAVPLNILWQIPQYFLAGASEAFMTVGQMEFFYNESPDAMRSFCMSFFYLTISLGSYLNSLIITIVTAATTAGGKPGWIPNNLNEGHLDKFFWLITGLSLINLLVFVRCAMVYKQKKVL